MPQRDYQIPPWFYSEVEEYDRMVEREEGTKEEREKKRKEVFEILARWMNDREEGQFKSKSDTVVHRPYINII